METGNGVVYEMDKGLRFMTAEERTLFAEHRLPAHLIVLIKPTLERTVDQTKTTPVG